MAAHTYTPIRDPSKFDSSQERARRVAVTAAAMLQRIARDESALLDAVRIAVGAAPTAGLSQLAAVQSVLAETDIDEQKLLGSLKDQLERVKEFSELDQGRLEDHIGTAQRLIRSGRVELFAKLPS